jgi:hypothetical protein
MNDKMKTLQISQYNTDYPVTLMYDECKSGESQYGPWHLYGVEYDGQSQGIFADEYLHDILLNYSKGDRVIIRREQDHSGRLSWEVIPNGKEPLKHSNSNNHQLNERTKDIHRQVCLKVAVMSLPSTDKPWTDEIISELRSRTKLLIEVLDGISQDDLSN